MDEVMFTVRMLAAYMRMSIENLAIKCEIDPGHLKSVSSGRAQMSAYDMRQLSKVTGIPADRIAIG